MTLRTLSMVLLIAVGTPVEGLVRFERLGPDPVIRPGFAGDHDLGGVHDPELIWDGQQYRLYYSAVADAGTLSIALATSPDLESWTSHGRVLSPGPAQTFDARGVSSPSVVRVADGYRLYYTAHGATGLRIGMVESPDGLDFDAPGVVRRKVLQASGTPGSFDRIGVSDPAILKTSGSYELFYQGDDGGSFPRLGHAISPDGVHFLKVPGDQEGGSVFGRGPHGFDDGGALEPMIWLEEGVRLVYTSLHY